MKSTRTHSPTSQLDKFTVSSEPRLKPQLDTQLLKLSQSHLPSIPELPSLVAFMKSEIKHHAVHAGPSLPLKLFQIDSVLLQVERQMLSSPQKTWLNVISPIWVAKEDG